MKQTTIKPIIFPIIFMIFFVMLLTAPAVQAQSGGTQLVGGYGNFLWSGAQSADGSYIDWTLKVIETGSVANTRAYMALHIPEDYEPVTLADFQTEGFTRIGEVGNGRDFYYYHRVRDIGNYTETLRFRTYLTKAAMTNNPTLTLDVWPAVIVGKESTTTPVTFQGAVNKAQMIIPESALIGMPPADLQKAPIAMPNTYESGTAVINLSTADGTPLPDNIHVELVSTADHTKVYPVPAALVPSGQATATVTVTDLLITEYKLHIYGSGLESYYPLPPATLNFTTSGQVIEQNLVLEATPVNSLTVKVSDAINQDLLEGVTVTLMSGDTPVAAGVTGTSGTYAFYDITPDRYHLVLEHTGYLPVTTGTFEPGTTHVNLHMLPNQQAEGLCSITGTRNEDNTITWRVTYNESRDYLDYTMVFAPSPGLGPPVYDNNFNYEVDTGEYWRIQSGRDPQIFEFITPIVDDTYDHYCVAAQLKVINDVRAEAVLSFPYTRLRTVNPVNTTSTMVSGTASTNALIEVRDVNGNLLGYTQTDAAGYYMVNIPSQPADKLLIVTARYNNQAETKTVRVLPAPFDLNNVVAWEICRDANLYLDEGTPLDLTELQVCLEDGNGTTLTVNFADFETYGITYNPAQGATLPPGAFTLTLQKAVLPELTSPGYVNPAGLGNPVAYTTDTTGTYPTAYTEGDHLRNYNDPAGGVDYPDAFLSKTAAPGNVPGAFSINLRLQGKTENEEATVVNGKVNDPMGNMVTPDFGTDGSFDYGDIKLAASDGTHLGVDGNIYDGHNMPVTDSLLSGVQLTYNEAARSFEIVGLHLGDGQWADLGYRVHLRTEDPRYEGNYYYQTNGTTTLQPKGDVPESGLRYFPIPSVKGDTVTIEKIWEETDTTLIDHVTVDIYRSNETTPVLTDVQILKSESWTKELKNLAPYNNRGESLIYTAMETAVGDTPNTDGFDVSYSYANNKITVLNRNLIPKHAEFRLRKVDRKNPGTTLVGAKFTLYDATTDQPVEDKSTYVGGVVTFTFEEAGTYYLKETGAPPGYGGTDKSIGPITTDGDTVIQVGSDPDTVRDWVVYPANSVPGQPLEVVVYNDKYYSLTFLKVDDTHTPIINDDAIFEVYNVADTQEDLFGNFQIKEGALPLNTVPTYYGQAKTDDIFVPGQRYAFREAKFPNGYVGLKDVVLADLALVNNEPVWNLVEPNDSIRIIDGNVAEVLNRRASFPKTGGIGSVLFVVTGALFAYGAWRLKKKSK